MQVELYKGFIKRKNSTKQPTELTPVVKDVKLKGECSVLNPSFFLADADSYTYLKAWGNYYFIDRVAYDINGAQYINCSIDVLASYKAFIQATSAFVVYSSSDYSLLLNDNRVGMLADTQVDHALEPSDVFIAYDNYVMSYMSSLTGVTHVMFDKSEFDEVVKTLLSAGMNVWGSLVLQFSDAIGSIIGARRMPVSADYAGGVAAMVLGDYNVSDVTGQLYNYLLDNHVQESKELTIPWRYTDFRRLEPFTTLKIGLPFVGIVDLAVSDFIDQESGIISDRVQIKMDLDLVSGVVTYLIYNTLISEPVAMFSGQCGGEVAVGNMQRSAAQSIINNGAGTGLNVYTGALEGGIAAAEALGGAALPVAGMFVASHKVSSSVIGSFNGGYTEYELIDYLVIVTTHSSRIEPSNLTDLYGNPCGAVRSLANMTGFVQTSGFSIAVEAIAEVRDLINSAMDRGVYIE